VLFNSFPFVLVFLPVVLTAYFALPALRLRLLLVVGASYYFYAYADWWFPELMAGSTLISWTTALLVERERDPRRRRLLLAVGVSGLLALLGWFKYAGFIGGGAFGLIETLTGVGFPDARALLHSIVLPIGISFYTFEGISYIVDVYRREQPADRDPLRYAFFISFFPHLIAGPIVRYSQLEPQLRRFHRFDAARVRSGLLLFGIGLAKKTLLADGLAHWVDRYLDDPASVGFWAAWCAAFGFGFQIYFDFSAYSDMAIGLARILGIELPWNFDRPYRSASPIEFWRRWHVTLSTWLRDYVYIPLGGNRKGPRRRDANLFATMSLGGLWHGASVNFVVWGVYHGLLLTGAHHARRRGLSLPRPLAVAVTFVLVTIGWIFFRMHDSGDVAHVFAATIGLHGLGGFPGHLALYLVVSLAIVWLLPEEWRWPVERFGALRVAAVAAVTAVAIMSFYATHAFIYFRF
jgi:alginate O-acetyltransferase complex protein AlgI